jgi:PAS domain-containing protein
MVTGNDDQTLSTALEASQTDQKEVGGAALRERTAEWEALIATAPIAVWYTYGPDLREIHTNRYAAELLGSPPVYSLACAANGAEHWRRFREFKDGVEARTVPIRRTLRGEEVRDEEREIRFDDGRVLTLL